MTDKARTKRQLMTELTALRQRVAELEAEQQQAEAERESLLVAEREQRALAEALGQTVATIASSLRGEEVLDRILEEMSRVVSYDAACLLLIEGDLARVYRWRGYIRAGRATQTAIVSAAFRIESIPILHVVRETGRPLAVMHPAVNEQWVRKFGPAWVKSYACAPIRSRGWVIGFLVVDSETPNFFEPADAEILQAFADQSALALENVALHNRVRHEVIKRVKALKKERNFISAILDTADALVTAVNPQGRIIHFNRACEETTGYTFAEAKDRYFWDLLSTETAPLAKIYFTELSSSHASDRSSQLPTKFELYLVTKTGQQRLIAWSNTTLFDKSGAVEYIIGTGIDITEQRRAEAALRHSEATQRAILDAIPDFMFRISQEGTYIPFHAFHQPTLLSASESAGKKVTEVLPQNLAQHIMEGLEAVFQTGEIQLFEYSLSLPGEIRYYEARLISSAVNEVLCILRDITERKQAEEVLRAQNEQLQARNQELDAFARTVAHDLKNPLGALTSIAEILLEDYSSIPAEKLSEYLHSMARSGKRASRIVEALLLLAGVRQRTVTPQPLDMARIVAESLQRLAEMIERRQADIIVPAVSAWPAALGYAPWIEEVWVNYLSNGLKYGGQPPRLELGATVRNNAAHFWVQDNGPGLTPKAQRQLFTEFTQLEPNRADGYGLGLSIVRRIIEKLGGQVAVESEPGYGTIFSFTLPLAYTQSTLNDQESG